MQSVPHCADEQAVAIASGVQVARRGPLASYITFLAWID